MHRHHAKHDFFPESNGLYRGDSFPFPILPYSSDKCSHSSVCWSIQIASTADVCGPAYTSPVEAID